MDNDALGELEQRRQAFENRRNTLYKAMEDAGFTLKTLPQGAFYLYWDISEFTDNAQQFCSDLLQQTGVAITPGRDFGEFNAETHVRLAYTTDEDNLKLAVKKITAFIKAKG